MQKKDRPRIDYMPGSAAIDALGPRYAPVSLVQQAGDTAVDSLFWHSPQPAATEMSDEELAHSYFVTP